MAARVGLVLGAGGVVGGAFHAGVLAALAEEVGFDARAAAVAVGTSAGSITAASLRAGLAPADLLARATGRRLSPEGQRLVGGLGPPPAFDLRVQARTWRPSSPRALLTAVTRPWEVRLGTLASALLPAGTVDLPSAVAAFDPLFGPTWPSRPLWVVAVDLEDGRRVVFGRDRTDVRVPTAVSASCAIPAFFRPVEIEGRRYVDGGAWSPTSADLLADPELDLDVVVVSSPMSIVGRVGGVALSVDLPVRRAFGAQLAAELRRFRRRRIPVLVLQPTPEVVVAMGRNALDPSRRAPTADAARAAAAQRLRRPGAAAAVEVLRSA